MYLKALIPVAMMLAQVATSLPAPSPHPRELLERGLEALTALKERDLGWNDGFDNEKRHLRERRDLGWNDGFDNEKRHVKERDLGWNDGFDNEKRDANKRDLGWNDGMDNEDKK